LTLDLDLCAVLDSALAHWGAGAGAVVNVHTGEILAAASRPVYDPNLLVGGIPADLWEQFTHDPAKPLFDRLTQAVYSPGSAFKPFVLYEGLSTGSISEYSRFRSCGGGLRLGNRVFHCWRPGGHGALAAVNALEQSCDVYFYQLGEHLGIDAIAHGARAFGLGSLSGIEISGEAKGNIPDKAWFDKRYGERGWSTGSVWNVSIGQGEVLVNCLQMARAYAGLATGGFLPALRLRHHVENASGVVTMPFSPPRGVKIPVIRPAMAVVHEGLELVLQGAGGTARSSRLAEFRTAGKTGTVENPHGKPHGWFCGYAPADDPEIAVAIIVEHAEHGSGIAPIFRQLVATHFGLDLKGKPAAAPAAGEGD
jgi:penicillin-binding protein 2